LCCDVDVSLGGERVSERATLRKPFDDGVRHRVSDHLTWNMVEPSVEHE
jgi:hypothetical protein